MHQDLQLTKYVSDRGGKNDGIHVAVVDDLGTITGIQGNILEKFTGLSKAKDAISNVNSPERIYYKDFIANRAENIYAGFNPSQSEDTFHKHTSSCNWIWNRVCSKHNRTRFVESKCTKHNIRWYR